MVNSQLQNQPLSVRSTLCVPLDSRYRGAQRHANPCCVPFFPISTIPTALLLPSGPVSWESVFHTLVGRSVMWHSHRCAVSHSARGTCFCVLTKCCSLCTLNRTNYVLPMILQTTVYLHVTSPYPGNHIVGVVSRNKSGLYAPVFTERLLMQGSD